MSVPTNEMGLAFATVDFGTITCGSWARSESELAHSAHSRSRDLLEVLEGFLWRQGLALAHCGSKDTDRRRPQENIFITIILFCLFCFVQLLLFLLLLFFSFFNFNF